jgi:alcohol dehydrogenase class IV
MEQLHRQLRLPFRLGPLGLTQEIARAISGHVVNHPRMKNNPRPASRDDIEKILWSAA